MRAKAAPPAARSATLREVNLLITKLSREEQRDVYRRLGFLLGGLRNDAPVTSLGWLMRGLVEELERRGNAISATALLRLDRGFEAVLVGWETTLLKKVPGELPDAGRFALGRLAARALSDYLARAGIPVGPRTMMANFDKLALAIDEAYPGYIEAGFLGKLGGMNTGNGR